MAKTFSPIAALLIFALSAQAAGGADARLTGSIDWEKKALTLDVALDLAKRGYKLPVDRSASEEALARQYKILAQDVIAALPVDAARTAGAYIENGELGADFAANAASLAHSTPPFLQTDFRAIHSVYTINLVQIAKDIPPRNSPPWTAQILAPSRAAAYSGLIIIADEALPVHGKRTKALPEPCLAPRLWDSNMNLLFDGSADKVNYMSASHIFSDSPGGLSTAAQAIAGANPLRIIASEVFGERPADLVLAAEDARTILSNPDTLRNLNEGGLIIILADSVLTTKIEM